MYTGSILIGLALLVLAVPFVAGPLLREKSATRFAGKLPVEPSEAPTAQREQVLVALRDLEFDHKLGKVADEDYAALRAALLTEAAAMLEAEDRHGAAIEAQIEAEIRARRSRQKASGLSIAVRADARFCSQCGASLQPGDRFCSECGAHVERGERE